MELNMDAKHHRPKMLAVEGVRLDYNKFAAELASAQYALGELQGSQRKLLNPTLLMAPLTAKEAAVSSKIEGTQSTVSDLFMYEAGGESKHSDTQQLVNYRNAMNFAIAEIQRGRALSSHFIKSLHDILLTDVRHKGLTGQFRRDRVWIGEKEGDPIEKAIYVPPEAALVQDYIDNILDYLKTGSDNSLIKAGISHYQFEAVHPFDDGNRRIGRLLIPLILYQQGKLSQPILYISGYLEEHRDEYVASLHSVDTDGKYEEWLAFFFKAVSEQLKDSQELIDSIFALYEKVRGVFAGSKSPYFIPFLDFIFKSPAFTIPSVREAIGASARNTVTDLIELLETKGIIEETKSKQGRAKIYVFKPLIQLLK